MGTVFRCCLLVLVITVWLIFAIANVEGTISASRNNNGRGVFVVEDWSEMDNGDTPYSECSDVSTVGKLISVEVVGCETDPCELHAGKSATVKISFQPNVSASNVTTRVHGVIAGVHIPFHVPNNNACKNCGLTCPISSGQKLDYVSTIPVLRNYPRINVQVQWELLTEKNEDLVCILIPAKIVS